MGARDAGKPQLINCTLVDNEATRGPGGALYDISGRAKIRNCIFWGNKAKNAHDEILNSSYWSTEVSSSNVADGWPGNGNINADPQFVNPAGGDYRLKPTSPCRDAGNSDFLAEIRICI